MSSDNKNSKENLDQEIEGHEYDGIRELNNPPPHWWQLFFYISIAFAAGYWFYYEVLSGPSSDQELHKRLAEIQLLQKKNEPAGADEATLKAAFASDDKKKLGAAVFTTRCVACHGPGGGGLIGPNLTDNYWIHGKGTLTDIYTVVKAGVLDKGMPNWGAVLTEDEMVNVVAYVKSLKGTNPPNPKAPQGELVND